MRSRPLRLAARAEAVTLVLLLLNVATAHVPQISSLLGPSHGCAYLFVVAATLRAPAADGMAKALALIPGIGGLLALRRLAAADRRLNATPAGVSPPAQDETHTTPLRDDLAAEPEGSP
ncbi:hypothetical protein [Sphaerisporangium perillae]|uniref:hypothetical protein n=1 Tax=Sphaerisporangium perillae TaxID=2935860 RepID=UPI00200D9AB7|nr:hypothetical protein [Sphaerisporangium perillae]